MRANTICAILIFFIAFGLRIPLVDNIYNYSFEPDSESCIAVTRSFYFFFKSPSSENAPQTLDTYPNYSDGDFITSALFANMVRPLCKAGIIAAPLGDGDNSLIIFSMRWCGVLFDAMAAATAFLILILLIGDTWIAMLITFLYYLLNRQTLDIDLIRIDHFGLFTANLAMLAGILLFQYPQKAKYYILTGVAAALVTGTKINFPFYLLILFIIFIHLVYSKKVSFKNFVIVALSFLLATAFMYQRWLMYPENIGMVLRFTLNNGKVWTAFWGTGDHSYYLWDEFFSHGYSIAIVVLLVGAYAFFIGCCMQGVAKKDSLLLILCAVFLLQSLALMFSPKIGRYGIIMPLWISIFWAYGLLFVLQYFKASSQKTLARLALTLLLVPSFVYAFKHYKDLKQSAAYRGPSINSTRMEPYYWLRDHAKPGSAVAYQFARASNPPVFELPLFFDYGKLTCPFLHKDKFLAFYPANAGSLKLNTNYVIINSKETDFHFFMLQDYYHDTALASQWRQFYNSLDSLYPCHSYASPYANYGLKTVRIYELNPVPLKTVASISNCRSSNGKQISFSWQTSNFNTDSDYCYEVQIAADSNFNWLISGSRDGFPSKFRSKGNPYIQRDEQLSAVPVKIKQALLNGAFHQILHGRDPRSPEVQAGAERFYRQVLLDMIDSGASFRTAASVCMYDKKDLPLFFEVIDSLYNNEKDFLNSDAQAYMLKSGLNLSAKDFEDIRTYATDFVFKPLLRFNPGKTYYWRVRLRYKYVVKSDWSSINVFKG